MTSKNNSRTLIKLDNDVIEVTDSGGALRTERLADEDLFEASLLDDGIDKLIENDINKLANEAYRELQDGFKQALKSNVLKIIGLDDRWGHGWEVDHCNGRNSVLTTIMSDKVQLMIRQTFDDFLEPELKKILEPTKKALIAEFKDQFERRAREQIRDAAINAAKEFTTNVLSKHIEKHQKKLLKTAQKAFLGRVSESDK